MPESHEQSSAILERLEALLLEQCSLAWKVHNVLAFMAEALPEDQLGALPVKCTIMELRDDVHKLGEALLDLPCCARIGEATIMTS
jgi:hypothetical protein